MKTRFENAKLNQPTHPGRRWGVILSGGNGIRLRDLVYRKRADYLPKQYVNFIGKRSMLEHTLERAEKLIRPEKLLIVITKEHLRFAEARRQMAARPPQSIVVQPDNKDTGPGILLSLLHLHKRDPNAIVTFFPSDHFILEEDLFMQHVDRALRVVELDGSRIIILAIEPHTADPEYGYILPGDPIDDSTLEDRPVEMFVEKPSTEAAAKITKKGGLWNTLIFAGTCKTLLRAIALATPELYRSFEPIQTAIGTADERHAMERVYQQLAPLNFSKTVLETLCFENRQNLRVLPVRGVTWRDWGSSERLTKTLSELGAPNFAISQPAASERGAPSVFIGKRLAAV